jgi:hypothetical protein
MTKIVQEKFQVNYPDTKSSAESQSSWVSDMAARAKKGTPGREGRTGGDRASRYMNNAKFFNGLPPGQDIEDQEMADIRRMGISWNGNNPQGEATGDVTNSEVTPHTLRTGFSRKKLLSTDDEYTREHNDAFYDVVEVDGVEGFVERNNMLDRL